ncbi:hypothetical protein OG552_06800 [Streptomyces sp. NBC_01476]|uniref:hypothetical protein n=1 Tax=Streptomyces sp. NBC_01476 TaxID=2903881 RepID=UPI002E2FAB2F|nr:hypothetical protein [Streptomyces sp. NBC_01476]
MDTTVWLINLAVLAAVLEADLGRRRISWFRLARPVLVSGVIIPLYLTSATAHGNGLTLEIAGAGVGILAGLLAASLMRVEYDPGRRRVVSRAGMPYVALWVAVVGARLWFAYASEHTFRTQLGRWLVSNAISADVLTDALIFFSIGMLVSRTGALLTRAGRVRHAHAVATPAGRAGAPAG